jgi:hypothetical protein
LVFAAVLALLARVLAARVRLRRWIACYESFAQENS